MRKQGGRPAFYFRNNREVRDDVYRLVCDDDKEIVEAIEIYLSQEGYRILKAYDGEQALKF